MGRASLVAFIPTSSMSGGSLAPIENSPPGIQTIPSGGDPGAVALLTTVGRNLASPADISCDTGFRSVAATLSDFWRWVQIEISTTTITTTNTANTQALLVGGVCRAVDPPPTLGFLGDVLLILCS